MIGIKGMVDVGKERGRARETIARLKKPQGDLDEQRALWDSASDASRIPEAVRRAHEEKAAAVRTELTKNEQLLDMLSRLSIE